ncbi:MAG: hypothetical protein ACRETD_13950 [Steroidobacteraceae bacterium]
MIELIGILACLVVCILTPIQVSQIRAGKLPKKFAGTREQYAANFSRQIAMLMWVGLVFGVLELGLILIETEPGEWIVKLVGSVLWFALSAICFVSRRSLAALPAPTA